MPTEPPMPYDDALAVLRLEPTATEEDIKAAIKNAFSQYKPADYRGDLVSVMRNLEAAAETLVSKDGAAERAKRGLPNRISNETAAKNTTIPSGQSTMEDGKLNTATYHRGHFSSGFCDYDLPPSSSDSPPRPSVPEIPLSYDDALGVLGLGRLATEAEIKEAVQNARSKWRPGFDFGCHLSAEYQNIQRADYALNNTAGVRERKHRFRLAGLTVAEDTTSTSIPSTALVCGCLPPRDYCDLCYLQEFP